MPRDRVDFHGRYSFKKKKKSLIKPEGSLVRLRPIHDDSQSYQFERLFLHKYTHSERFSIRSPRPSVLRRVNGCFLALRDMWSKVEERSWFPTRCPILHTGEYYHFLNDNGALWMWVAVECRAIGLHIFALLPIGEKKRSEETNSVKVVSCVKVLAEWGKKSSFRALMKRLVFPSKYQIHELLHGMVLWALLDMNNFRLEYLLSSAKHLVQGQCLALESHIAVCKSCCWS